MPFLATWNRLAPKVAFGALLATTLVDLGWILDEFKWILASVSKIFVAFLQQHLQNANAAWHETK